MKTIKISSIFIAAFSMLFIILGTVFSVAIFVETLDNSDITIFPESFLFEILIIVFCITFILSVIFFIAKPILGNNGGSVDERYPKKNILFSILSAFSVFFICFPLLTIFLNYVMTDYVYWADFSFIAFLLSAIIAGIELFIFGEFNFMKLRFSNENTS